MDREKAEVYGLLGDFIANLVGRIILTITFAVSFAFVLYVWSKNPAGPMGTVVAIFGMSIKPMAEFFFPPKPKVKEKSLRSKVLKD